MWLPCIGEKLIDLIPSFHGETTSGVSKQIMWTNYKIMGAVGN